MCCIYSDHSLIPECPQLLNPGVYLFHFHCTAESVFLLSFVYPVSEILAKNQCSAMFIFCNVIIIFRSNVLQCLCVALCVFVLFYSTLALCVCVFCVCFFISRLALCVCVFLLVCFFSIFNAGTVYLCVCFTCVFVLLHSMLARCICLCVFLLVCLCFYIQCWHCVFVCSPQ